MPISFFTFTNFILLAPISVARAQAEVFEKSATTNKIK